MIGKNIWHNCNFDILKFKITGIRTYEDCVVIYEAVSEGKIGIHRKITILLIKTFNTLKWVSTIDPEEDEENALGLQDFLPGSYYFSENEAKIAFYENQLLLLESSRDKLKQQYDEKVKTIERFTKLLNDFKNQLTVPSQNGV